MPTELRWVVSSSASAFHTAAAMLADRPLADPALADALAQPVAELRARLAATHVDGDRLFDHLVPLAAGIENNRELATVALTKLVGRDQAAGLAAGYTGAFSDLEAAFRGALPKLVDELALRAQPLREQWEARGPGLLAHARQLTDEDLLVASAQVLLVHPATGGDGNAYLGYNAVTIEALLANCCPELPEVVRLAWLVSRLNLDLPRFADRLPGPRLAEVAALAMIPPILSSAEIVELAHCDEATLQLAMETWHAGSSPAREAAVLWDWWDTYQSSRPELDVGLAGLGAMLERLPSDNEES